MPWPETYLFQFLGLSPSLNALSKKQGGSALIVTGFEIDTSAGPPNFIKFWQGFPLYDWLAANDAGPAIYITISDLKKIWKAR